MGEPQGELRARAGSVAGGGTGSGTLLHFAHGGGSAALDARRWRELADEQRAEALTAEQSVVFGQLGFFVYTMLSLGVAAEQGRAFVRAMCVMHNLEAEYSSLLLDVMDQYPMAGAALNPPPPPPGVAAQADGATDDAAGGAAGGAASGAAGGGGGSSSKGSISRWTTALLTAPLEADEAERVERMISGASKRMSELAIKTRKLVASASAVPSRAIDKLSSASVSHASRSMSAKLYDVGLERYKAGCYAEAEELLRSSLRINEREMLPNSEVRTRAVAPPLSGPRHFRPDPLQQTWNSPPCAPLLRVAHPLHPRASYPSRPRALVSASRLLSRPPGARGQHEQPRGRARAAGEV
jgi:hypothetical protein